MCKAEEDEKLSVYLYEGDSLSCVQPYAEPGDEASQLKPVTKRGEREIWDIFQNRGTHKSDFRRYYST